MAFLLVLSVLWLAFQWLAPEVVIKNQSDTRVEEVVIQLPSNRIVFGRVDAKQKLKIFYSLSQSDGEYVYQVMIQDQPIQSGHCGQIANNQFGKQLNLIINQDLGVVCKEGSKLSSGN